MVPYTFCDNALKNKQNIERGLKQNLFVIIMPQTRKKIEENSMRTTTK